jgi:hypothetical protein
MIQAIPRMTMLVLIGGALSLFAGCGAGISINGPGTGGSAGSGGAAPPIPPGGSATGGTKGGTGGTTVGSGGRSGATGGTTDGSGGTTRTDTSAAAQLCVDTINMYRATLNLAPYARWTERETCSSNEAMSDSQTGTAHGAFGMCTETAQDECPGWGGSLQSIVTGCLKQMWDEGPGTDFNTHGHYINMSSTKYTRAACGFSTGTNGKTWAIQNFK